MTWTREELDQIDGSRELEIAARRPDGTLRSWLPIWVVCAGEEVYVRTWYRRATGWFGHVNASGKARVRVPGVETDVTVEDFGAEHQHRAAVDQAYRDKYGPDGSVGQMISDSAAATTLRLSPSR